jgi:hypothetical protein
LIGPVLAIHFSNDERRSPYRLPLAIGGRGPGGVAGVPADQRANLPAYMVTVLPEALADLDRLNPAELDLAAVFTGFVGWSNRRPPWPATE